MPRIGLVEKMNIGNVLQRIEAFKKTGLLVVKQDTQWVEFYCREGRLLCVGPIRTDATLGERLLHDGVISAHALQDTMFTIGSAVPSETRIALTLMDLGYVKREELRAWASEKTEGILRVVLSWSTGEILFEDDSAPPAERLLVSLVIATLLAAATPVAPPRVVPPAYVPQRSSQGQQSGMGVAGTNASIQQASPTQASASQLLGQPVAFAPPPTSPPSYIPASALLPSFNNAITTGPVMPSFNSAVTTGPIMPPTPPRTPQPMPDVPMTTLPPTPVRRIDTSFLRPDMVLVAGDLSSSPEQYVQVTPTQWRLLTRVDGHTSLQEACVELNMSPEQVCGIAGELIAERIVHVVLPRDAASQELSPASREIAQSGLGNGLITPGYAATSPTLWGSVLPASDFSPQFSPVRETQSQWGNGGNGATFVPGQGWVASVQPLQPLQTNGFGSSGIYASIGDNR